MHDHLLNSHDVPASLCEEKLVADHFGGLIGLNKD